MGSGVLAIAMGGVTGSCGSAFSCNFCSLFLLFINAALRLSLSPSDVFLSVEMPGRESSIPVGFFRGGGGGGGGGVGCGGGAGVGVGVGAAGARGVVVRGARRAAACDTLGDGD